MYRQFSNAFDFCGYLADIRRTQGDIPVVLTVTHEGHVEILRQDNIAVTVYDRFTRIVKGNFVRLKLAQYFVVILGMAFR